jgi:hypothetical protein
LALPTARNPTGEGTVKATGKLARKAQALRVLYILGLGDGLLDRMIQKGVPNDGTSFITRKAIS